MEGTVSPLASILSIPQGRWLHYGINKRFPGVHPGAFSEYEWNKACEQASRWHLSGVTPKIAQGSILWYDEKGLKMLRDVAHKHSLHIIPMHYVNGDLLGKMFAEASIASMAGTIFGSYIPDMEGEWAHQSKMMTHFGDLIRHGNRADSHYYGGTFSGPIYPTTYGNPGQHGEFPYVEMNVWSNGWIPQVYFNLWTFNGQLATALEAEHHVYPQWVELDRQCVARTGIHLKPVLPLIGLEPNPEWKGNTGPDPKEIHTWLTRMQYYGYCGFWSDETYGPYTQVVEESPMPQLKASVPPPSSPLPVKVSSSPVVVQSPPPSPPPSSPDQKGRVDPPLIAVPSTMREETMKSPTPTPVKLEPIPFVVSEEVDQPEQRVSSQQQQQQQQKGTEGASESQGASSEGSVEEKGGQVNRPPATSLPSSSSPLLASSPPPHPDVSEQETQLVPIPPLVSLVPAQGQSEAILTWLATPSGTPSLEMGTTGNTESMAPVPSTDPKLPLVSSEEKGGVPHDPLGIFGEIADMLKKMRGEEESSLKPVFSDEEVKVLWNWGAIIGLEQDVNDPFFQKWRTMLEESFHEHFDASIGYPIQVRAQKRVGSVTCTYLRLSSGLTLFQFDPHGPVYVL